MTGYARLEGSALVLGSVPSPASELRLLLPITRRSTTQSLRKIQVVTT